MHQDFSAGVMSVVKSGQNHCDFWSLGSDAPGDAVSLRHYRVVGPARLAVVVRCASLTAERSEIENSAQMGK